MWRRPRAKGVKIVGQICIFASRRVAIRMSTLASAEDDYRACRVINLPNHRQIALIYRSQSL